MSGDAREPAVAGMFYPAGAAGLGRMVDDLLAGARQAKRPDGAGQRRAGGGDHGLGCAD